MDVARPVAVEAVSLPSGTITFAFTDIEGSTQRWDRARDAMEDAARRHDALVRQAVGAYGGHVFKTIGDAFCRAFARPENAVSAMVAAQRALRTADFSGVDGLAVRMALHTGTADERDGDFFGPAVNRVARLLAIAHGGQIVLSRATMSLLSGVLPAGASLRDLGEHRLKDLTQPEHVYEVVPAESAQAFPPLRSLGTLPNNLPRSLTSFVGREAETAAITDLLERHRLVTLVGSGGIGKTRIALQVAANLLEAYPDGVWFVEFAPVSDVAYVASTIAKALGIALPSDGDAVEGLARALAARRTLIVCDNCEHLVDPVAHAVAGMLSAAPALRVLATSRQALDIAGEQTFRMPSLTLVAAGENRALTAAEAAASTAAALFVERARAVDQRFALTDANAEVVADICRRLDGIPFAIELAAARVKLLSPQQLRDRLDERFRMLTGGSRNALPRQQTLRALIDWSFDLLSEAERTLFRRLATFVNSFALEGAVAVGSAGDLDEFDVLDALASLVDKSLVMADASGDAVRYRYLESTRAYAREKLDAAAEREACADRRLAYLCERFAALDTASEATGRRSELQSAVALEIEDVRSAFDLALGAGAYELGARLFVATARFTLSAGNSGALRNIGTHFAHVLPETDATLLARLWHEIAFFAEWSRDDAESQRPAERALYYARASGDPNVLAHALILAGTTATTRGSFDLAAAAFEEAERLPVTSGVVRSRLLEHRGNLRLGVRDYAGARQVYEELSRLHVTLGNVRLARFFKLHVAELEHATGHTATAVETLCAELDYFRDEDRRSFAFAAINLAGYYVALDRLDECRAIAREAIAVVARGEPESTNVAQAIEHLALAIALSGDASGAARLEGYCGANFAAAGFGRTYTEIASYERLLTHLRASLAPADLDRLLAEGAGFTADRAIALATR